MKVFISSTMMDLRAYHEAAKDVVLQSNHHPISMLHFGPLPKGATLASLEKVKAADLYIGIFADRYGFIEEGFDRSVTELEFDCAGEYGLDRLCFVPDGDFVLEVKESSVEPERNVDLLQRFKLRIFKLVVDRFRSVDDFRAKLAAALYSGSLRHATAGLNSLIELIERPAVRAAVWQIRSDLKETSRQLQDLNNHKLVHEALHELQFQCYEPVVMARRRSSQDATDPDLDRYEDAFLSILEKLNHVPKVAANDDSIWMWRLERARRLLSDGIMTGDGHLCDQCIFQMKTVLEVFPSLVNDRIAHVTRSLSLGNLAQVLLRVLERLGTFDLDERRMRAFHRDIGELVNLSQQVRAMVEVHDQWQQLDSLLRMVNSTIEKDTTDLEAVWKKITESIDVLRKNPTERIVLLAHSHQELAAQLEQRDNATILHHFDTFRWRVGQLFHTADQELKRLCDDLREIGNSVQKILEMVDTST